MSAGKPSELSQLYGEAVALRATCYFELCRFFGDVPHQLVPGVQAEGLTSRDEIYEYHIKKLIQVEPLMYHEEAPNIDTDIYWLKKKMEAGAEYAVSQLFYDNKKFFEFVDRARKAGVTIPIIPGIKPFSKLSQLSMVPKTFKVDIPEDLANEAIKCKNDADAKQLGIEWCVEQCRELMAHGLPSIHFYSVGAVDSIKEVAKLIY